MSNKILILWGIIIALLFGTILYIGNNQGDKKLKKLETQLNVIVEKYIKDNDIKIENGKKHIITIEELVEKKYIDDTDSLDEYCIKSITAKKDLLLYKFSYNKECESKIEEE